MDAGLRRHDEVGIAGESPLRAVGMMRDFRSARIRTAGLAMLRPRASDMTGLAVPGSSAARSADWGRHERKHAALPWTPVTQVTSHARLRLAWRAVPVPQHP